MFLRTHSTPPAHEFDVHEATYIKIKDALSLMKQIQEAHAHTKNIPSDIALTNSVLCMHIPGTSHRADSDLHPTYKALMAAQDAKVANGNQPFACHLFEGVGSEGDDYVSPAIQDPNTLARKKRSEFAIIKDGLTAHNGQVLENMFVIGDRTAKVLGLVAGAGISGNVIQAINFLRALEKDGVLPDEIFLSGYSRGAVNCLALANAIYVHFGDKIKVHLLLIDPVPGPHIDVRPEQHVVPPNVVTCTIAYAEDVDKMGYYPSEINQLVFSNPNTVVTTFSIGGVSHRGILFVGSVVEIVEAITYAVLGLNRKFKSDEEINAETPERYKNIKQTKLPIDKMYSTKGMRAGAKYGKLTPIHPSCSEPMKQALISLRKMLFAHYESEASLEPVFNPEKFNVHIHATPTQREEFILGQHRVLGEQNILNSDVTPALAKARLNKVREIIFKLSPDKEFGDHQLGVYFEYDGKKELKFLKPHDRDIVMRIKQAREEASKYHDEYAIDYVKAWLQIARTEYGIAIVAQEKTTSSTSTFFSTQTSVSSTSTSVAPNVAMQRVLDVQHYLIKLSTPHAFADRAIPFSFKLAGADRFVTKYLNEMDYQIAKVILDAIVKANGDPTSEYWLHCWNQISQTAVGKAVLNQETYQAKRNL